jgi:hypothetical protein
MRADFADTDWQPFEPEIVLSVPERPPFTVYVKVRDAAGNESRRELLPIVAVDDWPRQTLLAEQRLVLGPKSVAQGMVVVMEQALGDVPLGAELVLEPAARIEGNALANGLRLQPGAKVQGDTYTNGLFGMGTVAGTAHSPLSLPVAIRLPDMPAAPRPDPDLRVGSSSVAARVSEPLRSSRLAHAASLGRRISRTVTRKSRADPGVRAARARGARPGRASTPLGLTEGALPGRRRPAWGPP